MHRKSERDRASALVNDNRIIYIYIYIHIWIEFDLRDKQLERVTVETSKS